MKPSPWTILTLFAASAGLLGWMYHTAAHPRLRQPAPAHTETLADLEACCLRKHVKSVQYDRFARIADRERRFVEGRLFRAMTRAERIQEHNCAAVIVLLGGRYAPPGPVEVFHGTTDGNLERSLAYERQTRRRIDGAEIRRALGRGNRHAARMLAWAAAGDLRHTALMERCRSGAEDSAYLVCPGCGNLFIPEYAPAGCPLCLTDRSRFIRVE